MVVMKRVALFFLKPPVVLLEKSISKNGSKFQASREKKNEKKKSYRMGRKAGGSHY